MAALFFACPHQFHSLYPEDKRFTVRNDLEEAVALEDEQSMCLPFPNRLRESITCYEGLEGLSSRVACCPLSSQQWSVVKVECHLEHTNAPQPDRSPWQAAGSHTLGLLLKIA